MKRARTSGAKPAPESWASPSDAGGDDGRGIAPVAGLADDLRQLDDADRLDLLLWLARNEEAALLMQQYLYRCTADDCDRAPSTLASVADFKTQCSRCARVFCDHCYDTECALMCSNSECRLSNERSCDRCVKRTCDACAANLCILCDKDSAECTACRTEDAATIGNSTT